MTDINYETYLKGIKDKIGIKPKKKPLFEGPIKTKAIYTKKEKEQEVMCGTFSRNISNYDFFTYCEYYDKDPEETAYDFAVNRKYRIEGCQVGIDLKNYKPYIMLLIDKKNGKVIVNKMAENEEM